MTTASSCFYKTCINPFVLIRFYFCSLLLKPQYWLIVFITYITKVAWHLHYSPSKSGFYTHYKVDLSDTFLWPNFWVCSLFAFLGGARLQPNPRRTCVTSDRLGSFRSSWRSADRCAFGPELHEKSRRSIGSTLFQVLPVSVVTWVQGIWMRMRGRRRFTDSSQKSQISYRWVWWAYWSERTWLWRRSDFTGEEATALFLRCSCSVELWEFHLTCVLTCVL